MAKQTRRRGIAPGLAQNDGVPSLEAAEEAVAEMAREIGEAVGEAEDPSAAEMVSAIEAVGEAIAETLAPPERRGAKTEPVDDVAGLRWFGTFVPRGSATRRAGLPAAVCTDDAVIGLVVVSDPGMFSAGLEDAISRTAGSQVFLSAVASFDRRRREDFARLAMTVRDKDLDLASALASLGFTEAQLAGG
jgi:hypothetical protein